MLGTNIESKLKSYRKKSLTESDILKEVQEIFSAYDKASEGVQNTLKTSTGTNSNDFDLELLETEKIYHLSTIKDICIDYRLRFLDSKFFKGEIPNSAICKIRQLENNHNTVIKGFKIMAPSKLFKLEDKDDPLLFAPIGNDYFYLIHKWGNDLHPLRKLLVWPFKSIVNLTLVTLVFSYIATLLIPHGLFSKSSSSAEFWIIYFFMFKSIAAIVLFYGFAKGKNFNPVIWNSKYFNA